MKTKDINSLGVIDALYRKRFNLNNSKLNENELQSIENHLNNILDTVEYVKNLDGNVSDINSDVIPYYNKEIIIDGYNTGYYIGQLVYDKEHNDIGMIIAGSVDEKTEAI